MSNKKFLVLLIIFSFVFSMTRKPAQPVDASYSSNITKSLSGVSKVLLAQSDFFTENKGQWNQEILFAGSTSFGNIAFTSDGIYYQLIKTEKNEAFYHSKIVKLSFVNQFKPTIIGENLLPHYNNYLLGRDNTLWKTGCRNYEKITYKNVWKGIDLAYFFTPEGIKYEYYVQPNAIVEDIRIQVEGASLSLDHSDLKINTSLGLISDSHLKVFDQTDGKIISSRYIVENDVYSFRGIPEKRVNPIVIDPLLYSTYLGGSQNDQATSIAIDSSGCAYVAGFTDSSLAQGFPVGDPIWFDTTFGGQTDAFVTKLNPSGTGLLYSTYIGGTKDDRVTGIAVDSTGCAFIAGYTDSSQSQGFPVGDPIWFDTTYGGSTDAFVAKLNTTGTSLLFASYIGGSQNDQATSIAIDSSGCAYVAGFTDSSLAQGFPVGDPIWFDTTFGGQTDAFVTKLNPSGTGLLYSTYIGGTKDDRVTGIAVDSFGCAYIAGYTDSSLAQGFPVGDPIWFDTTYGGNTDAFVAKLNPSGTGQIFGTYIGGSQEDRATSITVDLAGNAYVAGFTNSSLAQGFPVGDPIWFDTTYSGNTDAFVTKINTFGTHQIFGTYIGGSQHDQASSVKIDSFGNILVAGFTDSSLAQGFPVGDPIWFDTTYSGNTDAFMVKLNPSGLNQLYGTYIGGSQDDQATAIALDSVGNAYVAGFTDSSLAQGFPVGDPIWFDTTYGGNTDVFVTKLCFGSIVEPGSPNNPQGSRLSNSSIQLTWQASSAGTFPIDKYKIYKSTIDQFENASLIAEITNLANLSWIDNDAGHRTTFYYWITALDNVLPDPNESTPSLMITLEKQVLELIVQASPIVEISLVNRSGQRTGIFHGALVNEIPNSIINPISNSISILSDSKDTYSGTRVELIGVQAGLYDFTLSITDFIPDVPKINNLFAATKQMIQINQLDVYEPDWLNYLDGKPFTVGIKKDFTGDGTFDQVFSTPRSPDSLQAILDFDVIHLNWTASLQSSYPIQSYRVFRSQNNQIFTLIAESPTTTYTDSTGLPGHSYYYYVAALDSMNQMSSFSPTAFAGPLAETPQPILDLSVELNKVSFNRGEDVIYKVTITNTGFREAHDALLLVTLPSQISYRSTDRFFGEVQPNGQVFFRIGTLLRRSTVSFQINASVVSRVIQETSVTSIFDLQASGIDSIRRIVNILLITSKTGTSEQKISVVFKNLHFDSETGTYYLNSGETLQMETNLDGFTLPYSIDVSWGDGARDSLSKQSEITRIMTHLYSSKGTMTILVRVIDSVGRTKEVNLRIQVR